MTTTNPTTETAQHTPVIFLDSAGKILPHVVYVTTTRGMVWPAISDGCGGFYDPENDVWRPLPYTFANSDQARAAIARAEGK